MPDFKSAFDNYNNKVQESSSSFSIAGLKDKITDAVNKMSNKNITALNELTAAGGSKLSQSLLEKLSSVAKDFAKQAVNMVTDMAKDAINQAINAGIAFVGNIVEDLLDNIQKAIFLPDELVLTTLKGSYEVGADLAYHDHTIRKFALSHDLVKTLKWVDEQYCDKGYPIRYNTDYKDLQKDLDTAAKNSCWKNLKYMFDTLYKERKNNSIEKDSVDTYVKTYFSTPESQKFQPEAYSRHRDLSKAYKTKIDTVEKMMLNAFKNLITYSYTYVNVPAVKEFFDSFPEVLVPKYFGITDDKYGKAFNFSQSDVSIMMPFFKQHKSTDTDEYVSVYAAVQDAKVLGNIKLDNINDKIAGVSTKLNDFRESVYEKQSTKGASLLQTALKKGSDAVIDQIQEQYYQNKDGVVVKKYGKVIREGIASFLEEPQYITQRNKNIKAIYSYMASDVIFADKKMVNQAFYDRCKFQTDDVLTSAVSKAKGILGSSHLVQSVFDVGDFVDSIGYKFIISNRQYIFDPKTNVSVTNFLDNYQDTISNFQSVDDITKYIEEAKKNGQYAESLTGDTTGSTQGSYSDTGKINENVSHLEEEIVRNATIRAKLESVYRFIDEIPLVQQRTIILKYLNFFYNAMKKSNVPEKYISDTCSKLMVYVFGSAGHKDFSNLARIIDSMDIRYLKTCIRILTGLYYLNNFIDELKIYNNYKQIINKEFRLSMSMMVREIQSTGFTKTIYEYDHDFLQSLTKQTYYKALDDMRAVNTKTTKNDHILLNKLDNMTTSFIGFNRGGIMGWDDVTQKIKYTDYETNDYNDVKCTKSGTFISGYNLVNSCGILKYDYPQDQLTKTNITSGSYDIFDFTHGVFFKNIDTGEILYWAGNSCVSKLKFADSNIGKDFKLIQMPNDLIICMSETNNGLYYWDRTDKRFVKLDSTGGQYSWYQIKNGWLMFSKTNGSAYVYIATSELIERIGSLRGAYSTYVEYVADFTVTGEYTPPPPPPGADGKQEEPEAEEVSSTSHIYNILLSKTTKGFDRIYVISDTETYGIDFSYDNKNDQFNNERLLFVPSSDEKKCYIIHDRKSIADTSVDTIEYHTFKTQFSMALEDELDSGSFDASGYFDFQMYSDIFDGSGSRVKTSSAKNLGLTSNYLTDYGLFFIFDSMWYYYNDHMQISVKLPDDTKSNLSDFKFIDFNEKVFGISDTEILYFSEDLVSGGSITLPQVLDEADRVKGWKFETIKCKTSETNVKYLEYLTNTVSPIGTRFYNPNTNTAVNVNLNTGYWKMFFAGSKFIATAYNTCNDGIRVSEYNMNPLFKEISSAVNIGAFMYGDYDYKSKRLYLCSYRQDTVWNIDKIPYDIDEFVYPLDEYYMQKIVIDHNERSFTDLIDIMEARFDNDEVFVNNDILSQYDENDEEIEGGNTSGGNSKVPEGKYSLDDLMGYLNGFLESFDGYLAEIVASSGVFAEIFTYAETAVNFDPDDEKSLQNLQAALLMLYSLDDNGNINFTNILSRYKAYIRKLFIKNNTTSSGQLITESTGSEEWNAKYNYASEDFLDSDETSENYYFKEKVDPIEYVEIDPEKFDDEDSDAYISKRYGIALYYRLLKYNKASNFAYFKTDYETETKYAVANEGYRKLFVRKSDLEIVRAYPKDIVTLSV